ncbi:MAG TPA: hypothetical protein VMB85_22760, partial [Bryobacteraceae bacterium]|nr:hypothetical protein [Bryobacteraceae bacterium]
AELARMIARKLGTPKRSAYLPPEPDLLFRSYAEQYGEANLEQLRDSANHFLESLRRTNSEERDAIIHLFAHGCPAGLPENMHINTDLLARLTGASERRLLELFEGLRSLGFYTYSYKRGRDRRHVGEDNIIAVEWHDMNTSSGVNGNATDIAEQMLNTQDFAHCEDCALAALRRLDFSHLSTYSLNADVRDARTGGQIPNVGAELRKLHPLRSDQTGPRRRTR